MCVNGEYIKLSDALKEMEGLRKVYDDLNKKIQVEHESEYQRGLQLLKHSVRADVCDRIEERLKFLQCFRAIDMNKWILCSDALPKSLSKREGDLIWCLATIAAADDLSKRKVVKLRYAQKAKQWIWEFSGKFGNMDIGNLTTPEAEGYKVIAWQYAPSVYDGD